MRKYETLVLVDPTLSEQEVGQFSHKLESFVADHKGKALLSESLGRKKLAYPINKKREGSYLRVEFEMPTAALAGYQKDLRLQQLVLRQITCALE